MNLNKILRDFVGYNSSYSTNNKNLKQTKISTIFIFILKKIYNFTKNI